MLFQDEIHAFQRSLDQIAEDAGGWRNVPDDAFLRLFEMYRNPESGSIVGKAFVDHEGFQSELKRRVLEHIEQSINPPKSPGFFKRFFAR